MLQTNHTFFFMCSFWATFPVTNNSCNSFFYAKKEARSLG